jgi:hypothetical protein
MRDQDRVVRPTRRRLLTGSLLLGLGSGVATLLGPIGDRVARAQSRPTITVHKSPT